VTHIVKEWKVSEENGVWRYETAALEERSRPVIKAIGLIYYLGSKGG
jgi:hypothetical protein